MWGDMGDDGTQDSDIGDRLQNPAPASFGNIHHCTTISNEALANAKTFSEMALIARIQVAVPARKLKLGDHSLTGHVHFFDRTANIAEVAEVLPHLAADAKVMEFTAQVGRAANHTYRDSKVRRFKVEHALRWLCTHSLA
jgi:hypothetical protein